MLNTNIPQTQHDKILRDFLKRMYSSNQIFSSHLHFTHICYYEDNKLFGERGFLNDRRKKNNKTD